MKRFLYVFIAFFMFAPAAEGKITREYVTKGGWNVVLTDHVVTDYRLDHGERASQVYWKKKRPCADVWYEMMVYGKGNVATKPAAVAEMSPPGEQLCGRWIARKTLDYDNTPEDVCQVVVHENGHNFGFIDLENDSYQNHPDDPLRIMAWSPPSRFNVCKWRYINTKNRHWCRKHVATCNYKYPFLAENANVKDPAS